MRTVILYKHGVGYFERAGELKPGEAAKLEFKSSEMNDVLKSLTIQDKNGGKVTGLRYDSSEPLDVKLGEFPFRVAAENSSLSGFLNQLKGARITLKFGADTLTGTIVSARVVAGDDKRPEREQLVLLLDSGELRTLDLSAATSVQFTDAALQAQLRDYLRVVAASRSQEKRSVYIDSVDAGTRQLSTSYMIPTPVWKSSYRLLFKETGEPTLEGWAIVDNTTGEDWDKVRLSLVSGRPVSFISKLYEPKYIQRPTAELAEERAVGPQVYEGAMQMAKTANAPAPPAVDVRKRMLAAPMAAAGPAQEQLAEKDVRLSYDSSIASTATGRELGDLFEYRFAGPVTVKKSESAMLPFLQTKIGARKLLIYSDTSMQHPMNAAELTNSTGETLDGGPITVFDANAYGGEALVETVKAGDKRLISYAVDLGTRITTAFDSSTEAIREIHARRGVITTRQAARETRTYTAVNVDKKPKTLIIQHPVRYGYKVLNQKPVETTSSAYRFEVKLAAGATEKFPVVEERELENSILITNFNSQALIEFAQNKVLSAAARNQLEQIARTKQSIADTDAALRRTSTEIDNLFKDQERVRQNISNLNQVSGQQEQVQKYARTLAAQESQLATLRDRQNELTQKKASLESELNSMIEKVEF
ncbi:MAG: DUF4139 domain-containing protein [Bryobacteraceae bacterium]